jgi:hypothetical protein
MQLINRSFLHSLTSPSSPAPASLPQLVAQLEKTRAAILNEFRQTSKLDERLLQLALNEAAALAWQTGFPQLVFPILAAEKAHAVAAWHARQQSMHPSQVAFPA